MPVRVEPCTPEIYLVHHGAPSIGSTSPDSTTWCFLLYYSERRSTLHRLKGSPSPVPSPTSAPLRLKGSQSSSSKKGAPYQYTLKTPITVDFTHPATLDIQHNKKGKPPLEYLGGFRVGRLSSERIVPNGMGDACAEELELFTGVLQWALDSIVGPGGKRDPNHSLNQQWTIRAIAGLEEAGFDVRRVRWKEAVRSLEQQAALNRSASKIRWERAAAVQDALSEQDSI